MAKRDAASRSAPKRPSPAIHRESLPARLHFGLPALVAFTVFACFASTLNHEFVTWDDPGTIVENVHYRGLGSDHLGWMFTTFHMGHYQPLSWVTFALDYSLWGMDPTGYHLTNVLLHVLNALLFYWLARRLLRLAHGASTDATAVAVMAATAALLFAIHPLRVESVAWVSERRDVLSGSFFIATILAYLRMQAAAHASTARRHWFVLSVAFLMASLLSKAWGMTLPFVLLALDFYPLRRFDRETVKALLVEKLPWLIPASLAAATAVMAQSIGAEMQAVADHGIAARLAQAAYGLCFYLLETLFPIGLSPLYPLPPHLDPFEPKYILSAAVVIAITATAAATWKRWPWLLVSWLSYAAIVFPVLGLAQTGPQIAADRYTYLSCLPWPLLAAAGLYRLSRTQLHLTAAATMAILMIIGVLTVQQASIWRDSLTLWNHVIRLEPNNAIAYVNRGAAFEAQGDLDAAAADYQAAIDINRNYADAYFGRGNVRRSRGDLDGAMADFDLTTRLRPRDPSGFANRGAVHHVRGDFALAEADYARALELARWDWAFRDVIVGNLAELRRQPSRTD